MRSTPACATTFRGTVFFPFLEDEKTGGASFTCGPRSRRTRRSAAHPQTVREIDANIPIYNLRTLERQIDQSLLNDRLVATLSSAFGVLATLLAVIGLYGVMAYTVARRTREIGVRMALGAVPGDVVWLVMREVLVLVGVGHRTRTGGAWGLGRLVGAQLYGVTANDPLTIAPPPASRDSRPAGRLHPARSRNAGQSGARAALRVTRRVSRQSAPAVAPVVHGRARCSRRA